jgi:hypothetical protein
MVSHGTSLASTAYGGADITVMGPSSVRSTPHKTWDLKDGKKELEGKLAREDVQKADGSTKMRADSSDVFRKAAQGLKEIYPETVIQPFDNVHDDEADGWRVSDSLDNFMEAMEDLNSRCSNLDFFAYCGHGMPRSRTASCSGSRRRSPASPSSAISRAATA